MGDVDDAVSILVSQGGSLNLSPNVVECLLHGTSIAHSELHRKATMCCTRHFASQTMGEGTLGLNVTFH